MRTGTLIKESLSSDSILDTVEISKVELWRAEYHTKNQPLYWTVIEFQLEDDCFFDLLWIYIIP